jgi:hypothetical protein
MRRGKGGFSRDRKIYPDAGAAIGECGSRPVPIGSRSHRSESSTAYSSTGCSPAEPASASPVTDTNRLTSFRCSIQMCSWAVNRHRVNADAIGSAAPGCHFYFARQVTFLSCADIACRHRRVPRRRHISPIRGRPGAATVSVFHMLGRVAALGRFETLPAAHWRRRIKANRGDPGYKLTISAPTNADAREIEAAIVADPRRSGELGEDIRVLDTTDRTGEVYKLPRGLQAALGDR